MNPTRKRKPIPHTTSAEPTIGSPASVDAVITPSDSQLLYTPAEAAHKLRLPESWLRRKAGQRKIAHTRVGKHLRFSAADLADIARGSHTEAKESTSRRRRSP